MIILENKKIKATKEAIVKTIAFFDLFDYPLTRQEIWKYANTPKDANGRQRTLMEIQQILDSGELNNIVEQKNGFYFLSGRENIIKTRMAKYNYTDKKIKRALRVAKLFKFIPWIKMIAVGNIIGSHNLKKKSDIDFFIITEPGRIWITRFFCAGLMELLGLRPEEGDEQDKICLSFFISEEAMDLQRLMLNGSKDTRCPIGHRVSCAQDIYFIYWLAGLIPIYDKDNIYEKFIKANSWLKEYLPNWQTSQLANQRNSGKGFSNFYYDLVDLLFGGLEKSVKKLQLKRMPSNLKNLINKDTRVVINDQVLKLHVKDRREEYRKKWGERLVEIEMKGWILG